MHIGALRGVGKRRLGWAAFRSVGVVWPDRHGWQLRTDAVEKVGRGDAPVEFQSEGFTKPRLRERAMRIGPLFDSDIARQNPLRAFFNSIDRLRT